MELMFSVPIPGTLEFVINAALTGVASLVTAAIPLALVLCEAVKQHEQRALPRRRLVIEHELDRDLAA